MFKIEIKDKYKIIDKKKEIKISAMADTKEVIQMSTPIGTNKIQIIAFTIKNQVRKQICGKM